MEDQEIVVLLRPDGTPMGTSPKQTVHTSDTPLHLAFSCYLLDDAGRMLMTRRALSKQSWPGVWTNSFCGHPAPGESFEAALRRRARQELGVELDRITERVPDFRYRAVDAGGVVENEVCPVFTATTSSQISPDPAEVVEWEWVTPQDLLTSATTAPFAFSPWLRSQLPQLFAASAFSGAPAGD